jgi:hypothetical protein
MEGKHTFETKAQNTEQSRESTRIEGPTRQPQEQGNTLSIQGNTSPANQNAPFSLFEPAVMAFLNRRWWGRWSSGDLSKLGVGTPQLFLVRLPA